MTDRVAMTAPSQPPIGGFRLLPSCGSGLSRMHCMGNFRFGSTSEVTATFRNVRYGRKADIAASIWKGYLSDRPDLNGRKIHFRLSPNIRHSAADFRCPVRWVHKS